MNTISIFALLSMLLTIAHAQNNATNSTTAPNDLGVEYHCFSAALTPFANTATTSDCLRLLWSLPEASNPGIFHMGRGPDVDPFTLPWVDEYGTCELRVTLRDGRDELSSWASIVMATARMISACATGDAQQGQVGGVTWLGLNDYIIVSVGKLPVLSSDDGSNSTGTATE